MRSSIPWTDELLAQVKEQWERDRNPPTARELADEVTRLTGVPCTRAVILGVAHRNGWRGRVSPVPGGHTFPATGPWRGGATEVAHALQRTAGRIVAVPPPPPIPPERPSFARTCCWPLGEPGRPGFRYCDVPRPGRGPYCDDHQRQAYARPAPPEAHP